MLAKLRKRRAEGADGGFTLIELLVVVVIIGVLVAIAVPLYLNYRKGAANKSAESDVRGAISAIEQFYTENGNVYPATVVGAASTALSFPAIGATGTAETATVGAANTLSYLNVAATYVVCGINSDGGQVYIYDSSKGGSVGKSTQTTLALCISTKS
jgi:type IV pilus assembly protein PilA